MQERTQEGEGMNAKALMQELVDGLKKRAAECTRIAEDDAFKGSYSVASGRLQGKASAYAHAAELVAEAMTRR